MPAVKGRTKQLECPSCQGTGVYVGWAEIGFADDLGVKCVKCQGSGAYETATILVKGRKLYRGRRVRKGIKRVQLEMGGQMGYNPEPPTILTYRQFRRQIPPAKVTA